MINQTQFNTLAAARNDYSVSIYIPTYRVGRAQEDQIRYKNALKTAAGKLQKRYELSEREAERFLAEARKLEDDLEFWQNQSDGLAVFIGANRLEYYSCPIDFEPMIYVAPEYYLRPIVPMLGDADRFHLLALSQGAVKLYTATRYAISEVDTKGLVPVNMDAALMQETPDNDLSRAGGPEGGRGSSQPIYFGRGGDPSFDVEDYKVYLDRVNEGVSDYLCDDKAPLLLGGAEKLIPIYKEANSYAHLYTDGHVSGNLEEVAPGLLHEKAWGVIGKHFDRQANRDRKLYGDNKVEGAAGHDLETVVPAAINGRVAALWMDRNTYAYGAYHQETNGIEVMTDEDKNATELLNLSAVNAFLAGARVYNVDKADMPDPATGICAIYRYAVDQQNGTNQ
ncbi:hypothetical protein CLV84_2874 [Neolewinella xylanilytica]|uniref:Uncharacterized protein n=1 Tax=Neolewinella xylanilytica TaxID=1514080 RepID=A0A2S6I4G6_9BACT|nr:hypothetical protein [Neolewinella xylanilytica]PPK85961.1 hypothetical protein CLV84_2874 [Neolewinella xylanilytica]